MLGGSVRIISADQANQIASDRLRGSEFGPCGGGVLEKADFVEDAAQAVLPGGEQFRTTRPTRLQATGCEAVSLDLAEAVCWKKSTLWKTPHRRCCLAGNSFARLTSLDRMRNVACC